MTTSPSDTTILGELLLQLKSSTYCLEIPDSFIGQFIADRDRVAGETESYLGRDRRYRNYLKEAAVVERVRLGAHRFGFSTLEEHFALSQVIKALRPKRLVEVGTFRGHTALTFMRACRDAGAEAELTSFDIDQTAVDVGNSLLSASKVSGTCRFVLGQSMEHLPAIEAIDFAFIDGDHAYKAAAAEFAAIYNNLAPGGLIAMHDIGTPAWGFHQDPGYLFFTVLPNVLQAKADFFWLDSMCRQLTMQLLSSSAPPQYKYCNDDAAAEQLAKLTMTDTVEGAGGLGFVLKRESAHRIDPQILLNMQPPVPVGKQEMSRRSPSLLGRAARRIASFIP